MTKAEQHKAFLKRKAEVLKLLQKGHTYTEIGVMMGGISRQRVAKILPRSEWKAKKAAA